MSLPTVTLRFTLFLDDFIKMQSQYSRRTFVTFTVVLMVATIFLSSTLTGGASLYIFAFMLLFAFILPLASRRQWKKQYESSSALQKEVVFTFSPEGMAIEEEGGHATVRWDDFYTAIALKDGMIFFRSNMVGYFIPRSEIGPHWDTLQEYMQLVPVRKRTLMGQWK